MGHKNNKQKNYKLVIPRQGTLGGPMYLLRGHLAQDDCTFAQKRRVGLQSVGLAQFIPRSPPIEKGFSPGKHRLRSAAMFTSSEVGDDWWPHFSLVHFTQPHRYEGEPQPLPLLLIYFDLLNIKRIVKSPSLISSILKISPVFNP